MTVAPNRPNLSNIPVPQGYKLLVVMPEAKEKTAGGIIMPDQLKEAESIASIYGQVTAMGSLAYSDPDRFPNGPWCNEGDFVVFRSYSGTRMKIGEREYRLINDDTVEAVIEDPSALKRV